MFVIRKKLSADEGAPPGTRTNPETGEVETTPDGGVTWNPNPGADPRINPANLMPATTEGNCAAATGMVDQMKEFAAATFVAGTVGGIATILLGAMLMGVPGIGWMFYVAIILAGTISTAGAATLAAAFTSEVWEQILCILLDGIGLDGQVSAAQLEAIQAEILAQCGATVATGTGIMFEAWGFVGLSNVGVLRADPEATCDGCAGEYIFNFVEDGQQFWAPVGTHAQWDAGGSYWKMVCTGGIGSTSELRVDRSLDFGSTFTHVEVDVEILGAGIDEFNFFVRVASVWTLAATFGGSGPGTFTLGGDITPISGDGLRVDFADSDGCGFTDLYLKVARFSYE